MRIDILTLFPEVFPPFLGASILGIAAEKGLVDVRVTDIRDYTADKHNRVDDRPYGGGPGMIMQCEPVFNAVEAVEAEAAGKAETARRLILCPKGEPFTQAKARALATEEWLLLLCGRYEGFDERIYEGLGAEPLSIGDYVLSGGEPAAMVVVDAVVRLLPGVLGSAESLDRETFSDGLLEYSQYTRPPEFRGMNVPEVLLSGDHAKVAEWRRRQALERTRKRRPDLLNDTQDKEVEP